MPRKMIIRVETKKIKAGINALNSVLDFLSMGTTVITNGEIMNNHEPQISKSAIISTNVKIWAGTNIREHSRIGSGTSIGQFCYVGPGVEIGENCKIQNNALIYEPAVIGNSVFIGPNVVITNDLNPRATNLDGSAKKAGDWNPQAANIEEGASLGAGVICVGAVKLGAWCMVAAGSVVITDVPRYGLVAGVPARQIGWVGEAGRKLVSKGDFLECPVSKRLYRLEGDSRLTRIEAGNGII